MKKLLKVSMLSTSVALGIMASGGATAQGACSVAYTSVNNWGAGAQIRATITNTSAAKTSWELCWTYAGNETIQNLWDGTFTQSGKNVCVKNAGYNGNLPVNGTASFGFIVNNPGTVPTAYTLNGVSCGGSSSIPATSSSSSSIPATSSSRSSSSVNSDTAARWLLDATNSTFHFVTVKKNATTGAETPENFTFNTLQGTVSSTGVATLTIPLASINTGNTLRDTRMQDYIFESAYLPSMHFTTQLDLLAINAMAVGSTAVQSVTGNLVLHGINKSIVFDALVVKNGSGNVSFSPKKPIVINSTDFDINYGVEYLRNLMGLSTIGEKVPVYFKMFLTNSNPTNAPAITLATAPAAPLSVSATTVTTGANLNWADVSANESGFLVRRKGADGRWYTAKNLAANTVSYLDALTASGSYDYKLISYTDSIPAIATAPVNVMYTTPTSAGSSSSAVVSSSAPSSISSSRSSISSMSSSSSSSSVVGDRIIGENLFKTIGCAGCHEDPDEDGVFVGVPFNVNSFKYPTLRVHDGKGYTGATPSDLSRFIRENMLQQVGGCTTANCSDHIAAYLWSLKGREQDVSCAAPPPVTYGIRSLKLLTSYEYGNSLKGLFRVPLERDYSAKEVAGLDATINHLPNHIAEPVTESRLLSYKSNAEALAAWSLRTAGALPFTCGTDTQSATCATEFLTKFAYPAFRRPLTAEETTEYTAIVRNNASGLRWAIQSVLMSPQFLYRTELGLNVSAAKNESWGRNTSFAPTLNQASTSAYALDPYEFASALSFMYQGSAPDATLLQAAANGLLENPTSLATQIDRLIDSSLGREHMGRLAGFWFRTNSVVDVVRMDTTFNDAVRQSMAQEIREIYKQVFYNNLPFTDIYKGEFTMLNSTLSSYYGIPGGGTSSTDWRMVNTASSPRGGVLASGAFMAVNAHAGRTSPIFRAVHVRQDMLCQSIPLPPPFDPNDTTRNEATQRAQAMLEAGNLTTTDFYNIQTNVPGTACFLCHRAIINPLFALDDFNNVGKARTVQNGKVMQSALDLQGNETRTNLVEITMMDRGSLYGANSTGTVEFSTVNDEFDSGFPGLPFRGSKALGNLLASENLPGVNACLINKSYRYAVGHPLSNKFHSANQEKRLTTAQESTLACVNKELNTALTGANNNPRALMKAIGMSKALRFRQ